MDYVRTYLARSLILLFPILLGCDSSVDPFVGGAPPFTMWGIINAGADTQKVRVFPIEDEPGINRPGDIDAKVVSTDLTTGEERMWNRREVVYEDGDVGQIFWSAFRPEHGHRYHVEVIRSDGAASHATVTVPEGIEVSVDTRTPHAQVPVTVTGEAPHIFGAEMRYEATNVPPLKAWPEGRPVHPTVFFPVAVSYDGKGVRSQDGWEFVVDMLADVKIVRSEFERNCLVTEGNPNIALRRVEFRVIAADDAWIPPGGTFDPDVLVEPGAFSNVENGYGFIAAGEIVSVRWTPVRELRDLLGFRTEQGCQDLRGPSPACTDPPIPCIGENAESLWEIFF